MNSDSDDEYTHITLRDTEVDNLLVDDFIVVIPVV